MARNGSGTYALPSGNPVVTGSVISSTTHNTTMSDIATALTASIAKDGQTTPSANLPMGGYKHTGVAVAAARDQYATAGQVQDGTLTVLGSVTGVDTITATAPVSMSAYAAGQKFVFVSAGANTGAATLNLNSIGAKAITKNGTTALIAGDIPASAVAIVVYDGTQFQLLNPATVLDTTDIGVAVQAYDADIATVAASQAEMEAGTEAAVRSMSPLRVAQAITAQTNPITDTTAIATTSGTAQGWTGIPSWVKRITVGFVGVSTNGSSIPIIQIGDSGGYEATGYVSSVLTVTHAATANVVEFTTGFGLRGSWSNTILLNGKLVLDNLDGNIWSISGGINNTGVASASFPIGTKELSATLDRIQLTMVNGTDAFDAGLISMKYE